jgi:RHS repeat-associated protein
VFVRAGYLPLQERDVNGNITRQFTWGLNLGAGVGGLLALQQNGQTYSYIYDGRGGVRSVLDSSDSIVASYSYDAYGVPSSQAGSLEQPFRFSTKPYDEKLGLSDFGYRFYSPALARWLTRDPIGDDGGINLYSYVGQNPLNRTDPLGLCKIEVRYNQLGSLFGISWFHAYVVTTDPSGAQTYFRGGPSAGGPSGGSSGAISSATGGNSSGSSSGSSGSGSSNSSSPGSCKNGGDNGPWGRLTTQSGDYAPGTIDWNPNPTPTVQVYDDGAPCSSWNAQLSQSMNKINNANIPYNPFGDNSNAAAHQSIQDIGFPRPTAPVWAPGNQNKLP